MRDYSYRYGFEDTMVMSDSGHPVSSTAFEQPTMGELFLSEQMSLNRGLREFGEPGANAVVEELKQLNLRKMVEPKHARDLTRGQKQQALQYLMYLKEKRCGKIKARGCADGRKQRLYKTKEETSAPTMSTEALFLSTAIDTHERRKVQSNHHRRPRGVHALRY